MFNSVSTKNFTIYAAATLALTQTVFSSGWAQFCDDDNCSVNCGISVSANNPGCLEEPGRKSVKLHGTDNPFWSTVSLVITPHDSCSCQSQCMNNLASGGQYDAAGCVKLAEDANGASYRFITSSCDPNSCKA